MIIEVNTLALTAVRVDQVAKSVRGISKDDLRNLQTRLSNIPGHLVDVEYWPANITWPVIDADTEKLGAETLTVNQGTREVDVTYAVVPLDSNELDAVLEARKDSKCPELKAEGLKRIQVVFPAIKDWDALELVKEQWLSVASAARTPTVKFKKMIDIYIAGETACAVVTAMTNVSVIDAYDVAVGPVWPV